MAVVRHGGIAVYDLPRWAVVLGAAASLLSFLGWTVLVRTGAAAGLVVAVLGTLVVGSVVTVPIVGVLLLVGGVVWMASARQRAGESRSLVAGLVIAVALPVAAVVASDGPLVECRAGGASTSSSLFRSTPRASGSGSSSGTGDASSGVFAQGGRRYTFECRDGRLARFTAADSPPR